MTNIFLELSGIEPKASRMRNERSTTELQPLIYMFVSSTWIKKLLQIFNWEYV